MRPILCSFCIPVLALAAGCGGPAAPPPQQQQQVIDADALMEAYLEIASTTVENLDVASAHAIVQRLQRTPEGLDPLLSLLADHDATPAAKVLTVISLTPFLTPEMAPRLDAMTAPDYENTTRACATHLLGRIDTPEAQERVRELLEDEIHQVRAAAVMVLGARRDPAVIARLPEIWQAPETTDEDRDQILLMLPEEHVADHLDVYKDAVVNQNIESTARERLAVLLGRVGDASVLEVLEQAATEDPSTSVRVMARGAVEAIQARGGAAPAPAIEVFVEPYEDVETPAEPEPDPESQQP